MKTAHVADLSTAQRRLLHTMNVKLAMALTKFKPVAAPNSSGRICRPEEIAEASMHKMRLQYAHHFSAKELATSRLWLDVHGWSHSLSEAEAPPPHS